jgi:hypothetical protein
MLTTWRGSNALARNRCTTVRWKMQPQVTMYRVFFERAAEKDLWHLLFARSPFAANNFP